jgi:1,4-dihydroxy-2-naphthoyl-CoA synthase
MQQAYRALRVISEAQTVHMVLAPRLSELLLTELRTASESLQAQGGDGIKAVILDFVEQASAQSESQAESSELLASVRTAVRAIPQPVLAVARVALSAAACTLLAEADFTLIAHEAELYLPATLEGEDNRIGGIVAARLGYATWSTPVAEIQREMERILDMLRAKSAVALRHAKASVNMGGQPGIAGTPLETLSRVNRFYLETVLTTQDAQEGLKAFLEKRLPRWQNR